MNLRTLLKKHDNLVVVYLILLAVFLFGSLSSPRFLTGLNIGNIMEQAVALGIVAFGQSLTILLAGIDLSVGAVISMSSAIMSVELLPGMGGVVLNICITLLASILVGAFNGFGIVRLRIPPFIMTLSTMCIVNGIALKIRPVPGGSIPYEFMDLLFGRVGIVPYAVFLWLLIGILFIWILSRRRFGRNLYAVGGNPTTAALSGISVGKVKLQAHIICSFIAAVAGICVAARMGCGDASLGDLYGNDSVAACVLGGISLFGGRGNVAGLFASAFILTIISNILNMLGVSSYYQYVFKGLILLVTVLVFSIKDRRKG